ncbi:MAG TPA: DUF6502 family protein [Gammaproteobacteria bacterium]
MATVAESVDNGAMRRTLLLFAETVLRPIVRILLRYGLSYPEFNQVARKLYVDVAMKETEFRSVRHKRQYKSRVACLTGLSRKEVLRLVDASRPSDDSELRSSNRAARVLEGWITDSRYHTASGEPLTLPFRAAEGQRSFSELVQAYSGDIPPRAVLDELKRVGSCAAMDDEVRVLVPEYVAQPLDIDAITSSAMRIASHLAAADVALATKDSLPRRYSSLRLHSSAKSYS